MYTLIYASGLDGVEMNNFEKLSCVVVLALIGVFSAADFARAQVGAVITKRPVDSLSDVWSADGDVNWEIASVLGLLSKTAYEDDDELMGFISSGMGFSAVRTFRNANSAAHVLIGDRVVVVAFRGTEFTSLADWKTDINMAYFNDARLGNVHFGFNSAYEDIRVGIENLLKQHKDKTLWITGHSLGGAMAVICAARCKLDRVHDKARIVTFGQPRIGDEAVAKWIDKNFSNSYQRFVNNQDVVPRLPISNFWFSYSDAGRFLHLHQDKFRSLNSSGNRAAYPSGVQPVGGPRGVALPQEPKNTTIEFSWRTPQSAVAGGVTGSGPGGLMGLPTQYRNQSGFKSGKIYQSPNAMYPVDMAELESLILEEANIRDQREGNIFFPDDHELKQKVQPLMTSRAMPGANYAVGSSFFSTEKITDHYMNGYLEIIRKLRR